MIKDKIRNLRQVSLVSASLIIALIPFVNFIILSIDPWVEENNKTKKVLDGYFDEASFEECVETEKGVEDCLRKTKKDIFFYANSQYDPKYAVRVCCNKKWGNWKEVLVKQQTFIEFILQDQYFEDTLGAYFLLAGALYITFLSIVLFLRCEHVGWRRLSITVAFFPSTLLAFNLLKVEDFSPDTEDSLSIILSFIGVYILGIFLMLLLRAVFFWIKEGFEKSDQ